MRPGSLVSSSRQHRKPQGVWSPHTRWWNYVAQLTGLSEETVPIQLTPSFVFIHIMCILYFMDSREVIKVLKDDGWRLHHAKGSHHQFKHPTKEAKVTVPHPKKDLPEGTRKSIYRLAAMLHQHARTTRFALVYQHQAGILAWMQFVAITLGAFWRPQSPPSTQSPLDHAASMALRGDCALGRLCDSPSPRHLVQHCG